MKYDAIIFDFDGTLANTREDVWESVEFAANSVGGTIPMEFRNNSSNLALSEEVIFDSICPKVPTKFLKQFRDEIKRHYRKMNTFIHTEFYPGIESLLKELKKKNIPCYIITMKPLEPLEKILFTKKWNEYFVKWLSPDSIKGNIYTKSEMIHHLIQTCLPKSDLIYIGDTFSDIIAAKDNKINSIGILYGDGNADLVKSEKPEYTACNAKDIRDILLVEE